MTGGPAGRSTDTPAAEAAREAGLEAGLAAAILAVDPAGLGGAVLRARHGPARERWLARLRVLMPAETPWRTLPAHAGEDRLLGGLDLTASLAAGRPIAERGLLACADGGVLVAAMAERLPAGTAGHLAAALDAGRITVERDGIGRVDRARFALLALDEGAGADERAPAGLRDRLALHLDLDLMGGAPSDGPDAAAVAAARERLSGVEAQPDLAQALCVAALALGIQSLRAPFLALRVARAAAALAGRTTVEEADVAVAARLVLAPRATALPAPTEEQRQEPERGEDRDSGAESEMENRADGPLEDVVLAAAVAAIPPDLLAGLGLGARQGPGTGAGAKRRALRGRPAGTRRGLPRAGARIALVETLRAAAPWQRLRGADGRVLVRAEDIRVRRFEARARATTIFVVDASGSSALNRLAEAKGAVELLLAQCYVRRDRVALLAFRGTKADLLLPPTGSLARAKRCLAALPGGGGTPLAGGIEAASALARDLEARGETALVVLMTDGRANIARDGRPGRADAEADAQAAARVFAGQRLAGLVIDIAPRPQPFTRALAGLMGARHLALPRTDAAALSRAVAAAQAS